jgi:hypothetical protein
MVETRYKFLRSTNGKRASEHGDHTWREGTWYGPLDVALCESGFHCSKRMSEAFSYVKGELVALVEVRGEHEAASDKEAWAEMRLVDVRKWRKEDSVALSIFTASLVLGNFEKAFPGDLRPRQAIEAAQAYLNDPKQANNSAAEKARAEARAAGSCAWSAGSAAAGSAALSAWSAGSAALSAARSAEAAAAGSAVGAVAAAAEAARAAVGAVAEAEGSCAWSAEAAAAGSAEETLPLTRAHLTTKISDWMEALFPTLPKG